MKKEEYQFGYTAYISDWKIMASGPVDFGENWGTSEEKVAKGVPHGWTAQQAAYRDHLAQVIIDQRAKGREYPISNTGNVLHGDPYAIATKKVWRMIKERRL
jgi:hypothetical protein